MFYRFLLVLLVLIPILDFGSIKLLGAGYLALGLAVGIAAGGGTWTWLQWRKLWKKYQADFAPRMMPPEMILNAVLIFAAMILFITPGLFSDLIALLFAFPWTRGLLVFLVRQQHFLLQAAQFQKKYQQRWKDQPHSSPSPEEDEVIDVDFERH